MGLRRLILILLGGLLVWAVLLLGLRLARQGASPPGSTAPTRDITAAPSQPATPLPGLVATASQPTIAQQLPVVRAGPGPAAAAPALTGRPYLGDVTGSSAVVSWVTRGPGSFVVRYGQTGELTANATTKTSPAGYWHSATLTGLLPGAACSYAVYAGEGLALTPLITFTTAPPPGTEDYGFLVLGDSRPGNRQTAEPTAGARRVAGQVALWSPAFVLHAGDIVAEGGRCDGDLSGWEQYLRAYFGLYNEVLSRTPFYVVPGNHELASGGCGYEIYKGVYALPRNGPAGEEEEYYSFDWANAHIIALDTKQSGAPGSAQYDWLEHDLLATRQRWKFVIFHHAPYSSGEHGSSLSARQDWVPLFEKYGVDVVFSGHSHGYERTCPIRQGACTTVENGGVVYLVSGGAGAGLHDVKGDWFSLAYASVHHFLAVQVHGSRLTVQAIDHTGQVIDRYELEE